MGDPDVDHGFLYDDQGRTDILGSPFFDVHFGNNNTADEYIDRILYQLTLSIEEHIPTGRWCLISRPPTSPDLATAPVTTTRSGEVYMPVRRDAPQPIEAPVSQKKLVIETKLTHLINTPLPFIPIIVQHPPAAIDLLPNPAGAAAASPLTCVSTTAGTRWRLPVHLQSFYQSNFPFGRSLPPHRDHVRRRGLHIIRLDILSGVVEVRRQRAISLKTHPLGREANSKLWASKDDGPSPLTMWKEVIKF
ncbi:hypothetical protein M5K25_010124 [Dendrobium thyrsiflorum]|uniref:Uncharacterized protein n=1 Tax=Dendrobium thyrsiflorum TaxID=117978 RepID=A0ABD0V6R5_DENTH